MMPNKVNDLTTLLTTVTMQTGIRNGDGILWRVSGDVLEVGTTVSYQREPDRYRQAVIKAGQLIQALEYYSITDGRNLMIQSFPNLAETRLIAIVRLLEKSSDNSKSVPSLLIDDNSIIVILKSAASHHGLFFHPVTVGTGTVGDLRQLVQGLPECENISQFFSLCSTTDNPFIWLKTGQWTELVKQVAFLNNHVNLPDICNTISIESRVRLRLFFEDSAFTQALVLLPETVLQFRT